MPLVRPMAMEFQDDPNTYSIDTQFMNGPSFLVAPVVEDSTIKEVYLPEGDWYDYSNGKTVYGGGGTLRYSAPVTLLPVFVKAGSIIPMQPEMEYVGEKPVDVLTLDVFPTLEDGSFDFVLYEDDGETCLLYTSHLPGWLAGLTGTFGGNCTGDPCSRNSRWSSPPGAYFWMSFLVWDPSDRRDRFPWWRENGQ